MASPKFRARFQPSGREVFTASGTTLLEAAAWADVEIDSSCSGYGTCGLCRVQLQGELPASASDREQLTESDLAGGWRLACQAVIEEDIVCHVPAAADHPRSLVEGIQRRIAVEPRVRLEQTDDGEATDIVCGDHQLDTHRGGAAPRPYGLAFDLGTTTVAGALVDLMDGTVVATASVLNRQATLGADVISRAAYAHSHPDGVSELQGRAIDTLNELAEGLCGEAGVAPENVYESVVAGNTIMLHILIGEDPFPLAVAPFEPAFREAQDVGAADLRIAIHPRGRLQTYPIIGTYAGGDTVAGLHATDIVRSDRPRLFIDIGTNTEVALGCDGRVVVASAPAGPAFEGGGVRCGMAAVQGAIARLKLGSEVDLEVIGGGRPRGICGTGLIDAVAELRRTGLLSPDGRLAAADDAPGHPLANRLVTVDGVRAFRIADDLYIGQRDIRELQSAIAAVAAAVRIVMEEEELAAEDLAEVFLAGSFGAALDAAAARTLGLVPPVSEDGVCNVGNAAIEGAKAALISFRERQIAFQIPSRAEYVELSAHPKFNDMFLAAMTLPSLEASP
jgi:uncharacterized 2Fe-2S/4Fe-4S cluster protein (DUF4445 family)